VLHLVSELKGARAAPAFAPAADVTIFCPSVASIVHGNGL
jgi:hypothetical protein